MNLYQLKISLRHITPPIWRRFIVKSDVEFSELHKIIQKIMGWSDYHLHAFDINSKTYSPKMPELEQVGINYKGIKLNNLIFRERQKFKYEYDFGDGWEHDLVLEKILNEDSRLKNPFCITGRRNCPPEDCGGIPGYYRILEVQKNPKDPEYEDVMDWLGGSYDSEFIDIDEINKFLETEDV